MSDTIEIRWHGRGGQGAKTAALLLADVAFNTGKCVQGFLEYGPERMGAPITAYNRISDTTMQQDVSKYPLSCIHIRPGKILLFIMLSKMPGQLLPVWSPLTGY